ncbi:ribonuclease T2 [Xylariaceae sp. FL1272]|nr:ribonuclease T2 [Xylariaceae sp. FL1272]
MASVVLPAALAALPLVNAGLPSLPELFRRADSCPSTAVQSCSSEANSTATCCVVRPGGQLLMTQFWDTDPVTGPSDSWTIHGLWPDNCDGTYEENCDSSREYTDITSLLSNAGESDLVSFMQDYWQSNNGSPEEFWEHEWGTHGTCVSTLEPDCYTDYTEGDEAVDFFKTAVALFKTLDTYTALSDAGITPSSSQTYTSSEIVAALKTLTGFEPILQCDSDEIYQVEYGFFANGPLQNGDFEGSAIIGADSSCPDSGIKYLPKDGDGAPSPTSTSATMTSTATSTGTTSTPTSTGAFSGSGYLTAVYDGQEDGCLIGAGTWYTSGTCATYTATASDSGFTLKSSKGTCGISDDTFTCGSGVSATVFTASDGSLAYDGATTFYVESVPSGSTQATVYTSSQSVSVSFQWTSV